MLDYVKGVISWIYEVVILIVISICVDGYEFIGLIGKNILEEILDPERVENVMEITGLEIAWIEIKRSLAAYVAMIRQFWHIVCVLRDVWKRKNSDVRNAIDREEIL